MKDKFSKTKIWGGKYHLLDLQESINNLADEFHKQIPVDNDDDLQELWNTVSKCCQKFIDDNKNDWNNNNCRDYNDLILFN